MDDDSGGEDIYAVVGVSPQSLRRFRAGALNLKSLMPEGVWRIARLKDVDDAPIALHPQTSSMSLSGVLQDDRLTLYDYFVDDLAIREARARRNFVFEFSLDPPQSTGENRVGADTLAGTLPYIQELAKPSAHSDNQTARLSDSCLLDVATPVIFSSESGDMVFVPPPLNWADAIPLADPGDFRVLLEASPKSSEFGGASVVTHFERVNDLFDHADGYAETAVEQLLKTKDEPLTAAFVNTVEFLANAQTGLRCSWATPDFLAPRSGGITQAAAADLYKRLSTSHS